MMTDRVGLTVTGASQAAIAHYDEALHLLQCYRGDPVAEIDHAIAASPGFVMAHALKAWLHLLGTEPEAMPVAKACLADAKAAAGRTATDRELGHIAAIAAMTEGHFLRASRILEDVAIRHPRDGLALLAGHQIDFLTGQSRLLRDRIARALPHWDAALPGFHSVLGMHAFGMEEMGAYAEAEAAGRRGVELEPRDGWSQHAVAHVLEMQGRHADGVAWMEGNTQGWTGDSFFQVHNWWHLCLYRLDVSDFDTVLQVYDDHIGWDHAVSVMDRVDASALLWRLNLRGQDVADRFASIAKGWEAIADAGNYAFNDAHAVMAFVGAGQADKCTAVLAAQDAAMATDTDNAAATRAIGRPLCEALIAFGQGDYRTVVDLLRPIRYGAWQFGGSHAQRDVIDLTLIEAAMRMGDPALSQALAGERLYAKHESPLSRLLLQRAEAMA
jgi:hypothetical protein